MRVYQAYTGADGGYDFFAPEVATHLRALFELKDSSGRLKIVELKKNETSESDLRVGNIINFFWAKEFDDEIRRSLAASWAGKVFARYPDTVEARIIIQSYDFPSMSQFLSGATPAWRPLYEATFRKNI